MAITFQEFCNCLSSAPIITLICIKACKIDPIDLLLNVMCSVNFLTDVLSELFVYFFPRMCPEVILSHAIAVNTVFAITSHN